MRILLPPLLVGLLSTPALAAPVTIENCGRTLTFEAAPTRAVSMGQGMTEIAYTLGLAPSIAGTAIWIGPLPAAIAEDDAGIPHLSESGSPSFESVLSVRPDLVMTEWYADVEPGSGRVASMEQFDDFRLPVYVNPGECAKSDFSTGDGAREVAWTTDLIYRTVDEMAAIFAVPDRGAALTAALRTREAEAEGAAVGAGRDVKVVYWFSSPEIDGEAYVAGALGAPGYMSKVVGLTNVITSNEEWPLVGWETIAAADPDVIVLGEMDRRRYAADSAASKRQFLETDPVARNITAVREGRIVVMDAQGMNGTIRTFDAIDTLAAALRGMDLAP
ncbi:ABC transporter substrate-binding protein [Falsirhodobacter halotolerans]|uniref:ABC transporter substrate-binding protein n=1 Tax=Falsirhodobacter halotolerans TaxID=1146892 RepID=UPI001FD3A4B2|nr:ABC transporter substrate-binding protein [Falsirhodobacter halotolerans]MCJ8139263.1 ABC transporter substrate-binding protein [Falsirhodobacter halotolerans]